MSDETVAGFFTSWPEGPPSERGYQTQVATTTTMFKIALMLSAMGI